MYKILPAIILLFILAASTRADIIILKTGEKFESRKVWEENNKIKYFMQGQTICVEKKDVERIIKSKHSKSFQSEKNPPAKKQPLTEKWPRTFINEKSVGLKNKQNSPVRSSPDQSSMLGIWGLNWNLKPGDIQDIKKTRVNPAYGGIDEYSPQQEILQLGRTPLDGAVLGFKQEKFYTLILWTFGDDNYQLLRKEVFKRFGRGSQKDKAVERYIWYNDFTDRMLEYNSKTKTALLWLRSHKLDQKIKKELQSEK